MFSYLVSGYYIIIVMDVKCLNFAVTAWLYSQMLNISKLILHIFINKMKVLILIKMMHSSEAALIKSLWNSEFNSSLSFMQNQNVDFNFTVNQSSRRNWAIEMEELRNHIKELFQYVKIFTYQYLCVMLVQKEIEASKNLPKFYEYFSVLKYIFHLVNIYRSCSW